MTNTTSLPVDFVKQGGKTIRGTAIGRKGKSLLISYQIESGEPRERWLTPGRVKELHGDIDTLPRYRQVTCKALPVYGPGFIHGHPTCDLCGEKHGSAAAGNLDITTGETFDWNDNEIYDRATEHAGLTEVKYNDWPSGMPYEEYKNLPETLAHDAFNKARAEALERFLPSVVFAFSSTSKVVCIEAVA